MKVRRLTDEFLVDTGFIKDLNFKGVEVSRLLMCVSYMRSMCINHVYQRDIQLLVMYSILGSKQRKVIELNDKTRKLIKKNKECKTKLLALISRPHQQRPFDDISATFLGKYVKHLLQAFVHVYLFEEADITKNKN